MNKVILDMDIFSESRKRRNQQVVTRGAAYLAAFSYYTISVVTVTKIVKGWQKLQREDRIQQFLAEISKTEILTLDHKGAELAGHICGGLESIGQPIGLADSMIAATALQYNLTLVTGNLSHYQRIQAIGYELQLDNWRT
ncbi:MAG: PIN domain-containing protein [Hormoscilla sp. SP12CHS1]|nr:PIN domain-containing protein [Hormoscilla sp. SP12CHS1]